MKFFHLLKIMQIIEIYKTFKNMFGNYASDAAMILFDNIEEWVE